MTFLYVLLYVADKVVVMTITGKKKLTKKKKKKLRPSKKTQKRVYSNWIH